MADGSITFQIELDENKAKRDLSRLQDSIKKIEQELNEKKDIQSSIRSELKAASEEAKKTENSIAALEEEILKMKSAAEMAGIQNPVGLAEAEAELKKQQAILKAQNAEAKKLDGQYTKITDSIIKAESSLADMNAKADEIASTLRKPSYLSEEINRNFQKAKMSADRFGKRLLEIGKSALIFNIVSSGLRNFVGFLNTALQTNSEYTQQLAKLRGALLTAFQPIYEYILPGLISVLRVLTSIVQVIANVISGLFGKTASQSAKNAKALNNQAKAIGGVGDAAREAEKDLYSFDEINKQSDVSASPGGGGAGGGAAISPDFSAFDTNMAKEKIDELTVYMSGALLALGAILAFSGANIPLGIGLMALGAAGLASVVKENWGAMSDELKTALTNVSLILGSSALAIGAILAFSGANVPLGIGLMAAGAVGLASALALNWDSLGENVKTTIRDILVAIGGTLIAIGAVIAFSGANIPLGIGLMAAGAVSLVAAANIDWNYMTENIKGIVADIALVVGLSLLAIGAVLTFSGANLALGLGLMAAGAVGLAAAANLNWDSIVTAIRGPMGAVIAIASSMLLALGVVLAFSGVGLPIGIALIAAGAAGLVSVTAINWNLIQEKLAGAWNGIKQWFNSEVAPKLTISYWMDKFSAIADGLKQSIKDGVNGAIERFNNFIAFINSAMHFSWGDVSAFGKTIIPAGSIQLLSIPQIPYLAQGAVIPPNAPFAAVLGDQRHGNNIEAPEDLIRKIVREEAAGGASNEEIVALLRELIEVVMGIKIGDETIGKAALRYTRRYNRAMGV